MNEIKNNPLLFSVLGLLVFQFLDKIEELTSIPSKVVAIIALVLTLIPIYFWIRDWLKSRK
jgi:hypothetical protein